MSKSKTKRIGITLGDPAGIGAEVTLKALGKASIRNLAEFHVIGDKNLHKQIAGKRWKNVHFIDCAPSEKKTKGIKKFSNKDNGRAAYAYLNKAVDLIQSKTIDTIVTAPVCKENICLYKPSFIGHTEFFAQAFKKKHVDMMFVSKNMRTVIVTRHIALKDVAKTLNKKLILDTIKLVHLTLRHQFKIKKPRVALCGLNPHAGEGGKIGQEEKTIIIPAIKSALKQNIDVCGPFSADTLFIQNKSRAFDCIIAMYHDQGLIPIKSMDFNHLVNLTIGLPFIRTSPAHGTAFDIAGKNKADATSMCEAIKLASDLKIT